jgi:very-short-patch-repair endonuclease
MTGSPEGNPSPLAGEGGGRHGRTPGEGKLTRAVPLNRARALRHNMTDAEQALWRILRNRQFARTKFRRQVLIGPYIADFVCYEARLVIEADGGQHADCTDDAIRDAWFDAQGFRVLRFWNNDVLKNPEGVAAAISVALASLSGRSEVGKEPLTRPLRGHPHPQEERVRADQP